MTRAALHAELLELVASSGGGRGGLVVVSGEAGIGKSTAVRQLADSASQRAVSALTLSRCARI